MTWLLLIKRFWPYAIGVLVLLALWAWHAGQIREARADERQKVKGEYQSALQEAQRETERVSREASSNLQQEVGRILGNPLPPPSIVVQYNAPTDPLSITVTGSDDTRQARRVLPETTTRDIGPALDALMKEADACSAQLRALQGFDRTRANL